MDNNETFLNIGGKKSPQPPVSPSNKDSDNLLISTCVVFPFMIDAIFKSLNPIEEDGLQAFEDHFTSTLAQEPIVPSTPDNSRSFIFCFNIPNSQQSHGLRSGE
jgi:hypothetical protein